MTRRILLLASHAVAEYDDVRMFHDAGYEVFAPGGYENPAESGEGIRPPLPQVPYHADLAAACRRVREERGEPGPAIDWAKAALADEVIDWADAIIVHHFPDRWIGGQWDRIRHKRVIWRTCGQSDPRLEQFMSQFRGLQIVRYSPAERRFFERAGAFAGEDALIRFGKYPDDYGPWIGDNRAVGNLSQHDREHPNGRDDALAWPFFEAATRGLPVDVAGLHSEHKGGRGGLSYEAMLDYLRHLRVYLYTGTRPASYTLALIEAMLSGVPVVSIGARDWGEDWGAPDLFEGDEITGNSGDPADGFRRSPEQRAANTRQLLDDILRYDDKAAYLSERARERAIERFGIERIAAQWREFLA